MYLVKKRNKNKSEEMLINCNVLFVIGFFGLLESNHNISQLLSNHQDRHEVQEPPDATPGIYSSL